MEIHVETMETVDRSWLRSWLTRRNISVTDIKNAIGHKSLTQTSETINGKRNDRKVLYYLLSIGVPKSALKLPNDMLEKDDDSKCKRTY